MEERIESECCTVFALVLFMLEHQTDGVKKKILISVQLPGRLLKMMGTKQGFYNGFALMHNTFLHTLKCKDAF